MAQLTPTTARLQAARSFRNDFSTVDYYLAASDPTPEPFPWPRPPDDDVRELQEFWRKMVFGKKIASNKVKTAIRRIDYQLDRLYDPYNDADPEITTKDYYAVVNAGSYYHVWTVIENGAGANSTVAPDIADVDPSGAPHRTSDGYVWKYMYSVTSQDEADFSTATVFPFVANVQNQALSVDGSVAAIEVLDPGSGYRNYATGVFSAADVRVDDNVQIYSISSNSGASTANGFYTGCLLYVSSGTGAGQHALVTDYFANPNGKFCVVEAPFDVAPQNASEWELYPAVRFANGTGQSTNAVARALIDPNSNGVLRVELLDRGAGYQYVQASVLSNVVVDAVSANVRVVVSPAGGHGADPENALGARFVVAAGAFQNVEGGTIPAVGNFKRVAVIRSPAFQGVTATIDQAGAFLEGEVASSVTMRRTATLSVSVTAGSNVATGTNTHFDKNISAGDLIVVQGAAAVRALTVASVTNATSLTFTANAGLSDSTANLSVATVTGNGTVVAVPSGNSCTMDRWRGILQTGTTLVGMDSGAFGNVVTVQRGGFTKGFNTFIQCLALNVNVVSGAFQNGESAFQSTGSGNTATGIIYCQPNGQILLTEWTGEFITARNLVGAESGAQANVSSVVLPEVAYFSAPAVYMEYMDGVDRAVDQSEKFTIVFSF